MELLVLIEPLSSNGPEKKLLEIDVDFFFGHCSFEGEIFHAYGNRYKSLSCLKLNKNKNIDILFSCSFRQLWGKSRRLLNIQIKREWSMFF